jgi:hypothetical protein
MFGAILFGCVVCSFGLPQSYSGKIETSLQAVFSPLAGPIQWIVGRSQEEVVRQDKPLLSQIPDEVARLREEKRMVMEYAESLLGQLATLEHREADAERIGSHLRDLVKVVKVISPDSSGRDILRLAGVDLSLERGRAVVAEEGIVGMIQDVGVGDQSSVRLITDKGFKVVGRFIRPEVDASGKLRFSDLSLPSVVIEGRGLGEMEINSLKMEDVQRSGLREQDVVVLADSGPTWPIEVHGRRIGRVTRVEENPLVPGIATIRLRPEKDLFTLTQVWVLLPPEQMPAR